MIFYWQVELLRIILSDNSLKENTQINNGKYEDNDFATNSMGQTSKIF